MTTSHTAFAARFRHFAEVECREDPLYAAICALVAERPALLDLLTAAPPPQQRPNLWLAAVHDRLLEGVAHPLAEYYPSLGGRRAPDEALADCLSDFVLQESVALRECMAHKSTQTNEIGRCAVLYLALADIARRHDQAPLALLDLGCSAGLNLGVDHYRYDYGYFQAGAAAGVNVPLSACEWVSPRRVPPPVPAIISQRLGIDPEPVDLDDASAVRWLRACIWPCDKERAQRFDRALAIARLQRWPVLRVPDCTASLATWLDSLPQGVVPVIFNSWVLAYFEPAAMQRFVAVVSTLVATRGAVWLSAEDAGLKFGRMAVPPALAGLKQASTSHWTLCTGHGGVAQFELLARSHPHGRWVEWLG